MTSSLYCSRDTSWGGAEMNQGTTQREGSSWHVTLNKLDALACDATRVMLHTPHLLQKSGRFLEEGSTLQQSRVRAAM